MTPMQRNRALMNDIASQYGKTVDDVLGRTRCEVALAAKRACAMRLLEANDNCYSTVGRIMGRDHSTIIYYVRGKK